jgi:hypothetical protein
MSSVDLAGLLGGAPPPAGADAKANAAVTSDHTGGLLDFVRQAILSLQHFAEQTNDDAELAQVHKLIAGCQQLLAGHAKDRESALGMTPSMRTVKRSSSGY